MRNWSRTFWSVALSICISVNSRNLTALLLEIIAQLIFKINAQWWKLILHFKKRNGEADSDVESGLPQFQSNICTTTPQWLMQFYISQSAEFSRESDTQAHNCCDIWLEIISALSSEAASLNILCKMDIS